MAGNYPLTWYRPCVVLAYMFVFGTEREHPKEIGKIFCFFEICIILLSSSTSGALVSSFFLCP